ncbi:uncharacterized protein LOC108629984 [Ceratina calcarata]|uniref:Uncharacterized protein LOC108629984 n=1 Tax=Ceratina calcarata TaxID=156304 RepID=A0AAJ7S8N6_9HYME|nr:uncharacterized protein LOC108629984 [Ceratina calcarata]
MRGPTEAENDSSGGPVHGDVFLVSGGPTSSTEGEMLSVNSENLDPFDQMSGPTEAENDSSGGRSGCGDLQRKQQLMLKKRRVLSALARLENCVEDAKRRRIIKRQKNKRDERRTFAKSMLRIFRQLSDQRFLEAKEKIEKVLNESLQEQYLSDEEK